MDWLWLVIVLDAAALAVAYSFALSHKLYNRMYPRLFSRKYRRYFHPRLSVFIPCKGIDPHFEKNIQAFLSQAYQQTTLFFIVESQNDPAYAVIKQLITHARDTYLIVAGLTEVCGQKNHNLLQGIKASEERDDVYVFLDGYTTLTAQQLQDLIAPLSDPKVSVSVGFRWNILSQQTLGERLHAFMIALQWSIMNCAWIPSIWGGAMALRRETFEKMGVREYWAETSVDDMTLQHLVQKQRRKAVFVPSCVKETNNTIKTVGGAIVWFKRQCLYLKFYLRPLWVCLIATFVYPAVNIIAFPALMGYSMTAPGKKAMPLTLTTGAFIVGLMFYCLLIKRSAKDNNPPFIWFLLSPLYMVLTCYAIVLTMFTNVLAWRGIVYHLDRRGFVKKIVRR